VAHADAGAEPQDWPEREPTSAGATCSRSYAGPSSGPVVGLIFAITTREACETKLDCPLRKIAVGRNRSRRCRGHERHAVELDAVRPNELVDAPADLVANTPSLVVIEPVEDDRNRSCRLVQEPPKRVGIGEMPGKRDLVEARL
jgi:hypothetical protein